MTGAARIQTERSMLPALGASFHRREDGAVMFQFVIDTSNVIGPRPASRGDQETHPAAWDAFIAAEGVSALDRDAKGGAGGSLPAETAARVPVEFTAPAATTEYRASGADPKVDEQDYQPGEIACGPPMAEAEPKPKRKYTRRQKD